MAMAGAQCVMWRLRRADIGNAGNSEKWRDDVEVASTAAWKFSLDGQYCDKGAHDIQHAS